MGINKTLIPLQKQLGKLRTTYPGWSGKLIRNGLSLTGNVQPTALSPVYKIKIRYIPKQRPRVQVLSPPLKLNPEKDKLPHYFIRYNALCLHFNDFDYYNDYLSDTIIVWTTWWLYFYEIWYVTGNWQGGGIHPE